MHTLRKLRLPADQDLPADSLADLVRGATSAALSPAIEPSAINPPAGRIRRASAVPSRRAQRAPRPPHPRIFRGSTAQVQGLYPWLHGAPLPPAGPYIGVDCLSGAAFSCHPVEWLRQGLVTNPN